MYGRQEKCIQVLVRRPEGKRQLGKPKYKWKDNIKRIFKKWDEGAWTGLACLRTGLGVGFL
jgi:hypothetical protein